MGKAGIVGATASDGASLASPMIAKVVPTSATPSSGTRISNNTPATGEGTSVSTLSVEISTSTSSTATVSPTCFSQRETVPSVTLSPSAGSGTGVDIRAAPNACWHLQSSDYPPAIAS